MIPQCCYFISECNIEEAMFFIVSPKDFVVAKLRDEDDHVTWLTEHEMFQVSNCQHCLTHLGMSLPWSLRISELVFETSVLLYLESGLWKLNLFLETGFMLS